MGRSFLKVLVLSILGCSYAFALEGVSDGGKVVHVATIDGALLFNIAGATQTNRPVCANSGRFSVPEKSGHAAAVLVAFSTGKSLGNIRGTGTCTLWGNAEDIRWIEVCPSSGC